MATLSELLAENTAARRKILSADDWDVIDGSIADLATTGIRNAVPTPGAAAPAFALPNALGRTVSSADLLARGPLVVKFYRGAWCSYCNVEVRALMGVLDEIRSLGADMVAITPELPDQIATLQEKHDLKFEVLSDLGNAIARQYGLVWTLPQRVRAFYAKIGLDLERSNGDASWELPIPGNFVVAQDGTILDVFAEPDYRIRQEPADVVAVLRRHLGQ
ncbi:MAG: peroxiredoxin-like family protein [Thalassobaculaceae bacterium]|nr:peroxiredoxin-like family protein [Thalassobaculaceae bacterium]